MPQPYPSLSLRGQAHRMRRIAVQALGAWGMTDAELRLINHGFNTTFRVTTHSERYALRINVNSVHSLPETYAEVDWLEHLKQEPSLDTPRLVKARSGEPLVLIDDSGFDRPLPCLLFEWLPGPNLAGRETVASYESLGMAMRALHRNTRTLELSSRAELKEITDPLLGLPLDLRGHPADLPLFREVVAEAQESFQVLRSTPAIPLHYDLHGHNLKFHGGRLAVFDFDDCVAGRPILDPAVTLYYLRNHRRAELLEAAMWKGFGSGPDAHGLSERQFEVIVAARAVLLANDIVQTNNRELLDYIPTYLKRCDARLAHFARTGRFDPKQHGESA